MEEGGEAALVSLSASLLILNMLCSPLLLLQPVGNTWLWRYRCQVRRGLAHRPGNVSDKIGLSTTQLVPPDWGLAWSEGRIYPRPVIDTPNHLIPCALPDGKLMTCSTS